MRQYYEDNKCPITLHWDSVFCIYVKIIKIISKDLKKNDNTSKITVNRRQQS